MLEIYKRGQGKYTRILTIVGVMTIVVIGAAVLSEKLHSWLPMTATGFYLSYAIPTALVLGLGVLMLWVVNRPGSADFLIATESEMKKVSWSSKKEIIGSTKVVVITTFMMAGILYGVDFLFGLIFSNIMKTH